MTETPKEKHGKETGESVLPLLASNTVSSQPTPQVKFPFFLSSFLPFFLSSFLLSFFSLDPFSQQAIPQEEISATTDIKNTATTTSVATKTDSSKAIDPKEKELIEIGALKDTSSKKKHIQEAVESGALPQSALNEIQLESGTDEDDEEEDEKDKYKSIDDEKQGVAYNYTFFHLIFGLASMYVAMLINGWSTVDSETGDLVMVGHSWTSVWVKVVSSWITYLLYYWTLVAPILLPDRDWS